MRKHFAGVLDREHRSAGANAGRQCRPGAGCVSLFKDSALTLGQIGDALVYFGKP